MGMGYVSLSWCCKMLSLIVLNHFINFLWLSNYHRLRPVLFPLTSSTVATFFSEVKESRLIFKAEEQNSLDGGVGLGSAIINLTESTIREKSLKAMRKMADSQSRV